MKKFSIPIALVLLDLYALPGCSKESSAPAPVVIKVNNARFAAVAAIPNVGMKYTELACTTTDSLPGTECFRAPGTSCGAESMCVPLPPQIQSGQYTRSEIDQKIKLVEKSFGVKYTY